MILYKYLPAERIDILENLKIRFSQPITLNDLFESYVHITFPLDNRALFKQLIDRIVSTNYPLEYEDKLREELWGIYQNINIKNKAEEMLLHFLSNFTFLLSLSEKNNNEIMWAHYADQHRGFVIGFDNSNNFFKEKNSVHGLKPIKYTNERSLSVYKSINQIIEGVFYSKNKLWEYEYEWRIFKSIKFDLDDRLKFISGDIKKNFHLSQKDKNGTPCVLFDLPSNIISEVIVGTRLSEDNMNRIKVALEQNNIRASLKKVIVNKTNFSLEIEDA